MLPPSAYPTPCRSAGSPPSRPLPPPSSSSSPTWSAQPSSWFSTGGDLDPSVPVKLIWGVILGALGLVMILSGSMEIVRSIIALGALPFVYIVLLLIVCLLRVLKTETA